MRRRKDSIFYQFLCYGAKVKSPQRHHRGAMMVRLNRLTAKKKTIHFHLVANGFAQTPAPLALWWTKTSRWLGESLLDDTEDQKKSETKMFRINTIRWCKYITTCVARAQRTGGVFKPQTPGLQVMHANPLAKGTSSWPPGQRAWSIGGIVTGPSTVTHV